MKKSTVVHFPPKQDPFDPEYLKLTRREEALAKHLEGKNVRFALGPIFRGMIRACALADSGALALLMAIRGEQRMTGRPAVVSNKLAEEVGLSAKQRRRALGALERIGLVDIERKPGCAPRAKEVLRRWR